MVRTTFAVAFLLFISISLALGQEKLSAESASAILQKNFASAYNRGDLDAMAAAFDENAIRVTPSGIFQGRADIRRSFQEALKIGLHDYSVRRVISHSEGSFILNVGEWQAKVGDQPFHGYYSAILAGEGDETRIIEETVSIAAP
ncbi:nuclear transport factor 2 family protein [Bradyrhizobium sp. NDS-1]|uniref:YybH family protein n=1 Tax=Bradyrhizobium sp. NDS-1 TaxID=3080014 RepID=UPI00293F3E48|nr:nuclear transport factor 2 family protein [Bradyrhizobium sp. NDS-1]WOH74047.1 nuclear transport factor 2 family protein [Bradyrhizobium sp. NDS-1]